MSLISRRLNAYFTVNDVETGLSEAYPQLQPLTLDVPFGDVFDLSMEVINSLPHWSLVSTCREEGRIQAEIETRFFKFIDDFFLTITQSCPVTLSARSRSRIGKGDFGKNARNIELFLRRLMRRVEADRNQDKE